jgi:hypothetical protein
MEFKSAIKMYLDVQAMQDAEFKAKYSNPFKNIDECCLYIQSQILKRATGEKKDGGRRSACVVPTDEEVFALAVQYYMDADLKVDGTEFDNIKVLSMSATSFTDEEKEEMRKQAIEKYQRDVIEEQRKKDEERRQKQTKTKEKKPANPILVPDTKENGEEPKHEKKEEAQQLSLF